jgi:uncharacterized protein YjiS (DUF1127 family)
MERKMSAFVRTTRSPIGFSAAVAAVRAVYDILAKARTAVRNRREVAHLLSADPAMLRDLGLTPMDVSCALAEPMWRDPSARLLVWSIERRAAQRAAARENLEVLGRPLAACRMDPETF